MDESKEYIRICEGAYKLREQKYKQGWNEGDWVYVGEPYGVIVLAFDFLNIGKNWKTEWGYEYKFAVHEPLKAVHYESEYPPKLECRMDKFIIKNFANSIWLPTQSQLQAMVIGKTEFSTRAMTGYLVSAIDEFANRFWIMASAGIREDISWCPASMEQLWFAFVMSEKFNKFWNGEKWEKK